MKDQNIGRAERRRHIKNGRCGELAGVSSLPAVTNANATDSLLLRLPAELRDIILRMIIGDGVIHVYMLRKRLKRSFCIAEGPRLEDAKDPTDVVLRTSPSAEDPSTVLPAFHNNCTHLVYYGTNELVEQLCRASRRWQVLATCRLIYQEAFPIFWRTMRFCFYKNRALNQFLGRLSRAQKENLRQLVIIHNLFDSLIDDPLLYDAPEPVEWLVCNEKRGLFALRSIIHFELHLRVPTRWWIQLNRRGHAASIESSFEMFENLRLLGLKKASVVLSYHGRRLDEPRPLLCNGELASLAKKYTQRLLNADQSPGAFLAEKLRKVGKAMREAESDPVLEKEHKLKTFKMLADQDGVSAGVMRQRLVIASNREEAREQALLVKMTGQKMEKPKLEDIWTTDLIDLYDSLNI